MIYKNSNNNKAMFFLWILEKMNKLNLKKKMGSTLRNR